MKVVIAGGSHEADYIIGMFKENKKNKIIIINPNEEICKYLSKKNNVDVIYGKPTKEYDLMISQIDDADLFIALSQKDVDNYVACLMAKKLFRAKKCIASVMNPKNVDLFKKLGIDSVVSSTYLIAETIKSEANVENLIRTLSLEDDKIIISEVIIKKEYDICNKLLKDISFPTVSNVCCLYRYPHVIIPNGLTKLEENDKIFVFSTKENQKEIIDFIQRKKVNEKDK